jgi:hypothetical protein
MSEGYSNLVILSRAADTRLLYEREEGIGDVGFQVCKRGGEFCPAHYPGKVSESRL